jgi:energy-coupling factor transport system ATP-binding protein
MESLGLPGDVMRRRVEETLDLLGLADLRARPLEQLSGGQRQRVAIGSVLTTHPSVLVLDEPTSALDPPAAEEVLAALQRLVHDLGMTVVLAEHRLERVVQYADRIVHVPGRGLPVVAGDPATVLATTPVAPPVVELGRVAGWRPLPLTVRDARRHAGELRRRLADRTASPRRRRAGRPPRRRSWGRGGPPRRGVGPARLDARPARRGGGRRCRRGRRAHGTQRRGQVHAARDARRAPATAVGHGDGRRQRPRTLAPRELLRRVGLVPQEPTDLLYAPRSPRSAVPRTTTRAWRSGPAGSCSSGWSPGSTTPPTRATSPRAAPRARPRDRDDRLATAAAAGRAHARARLPRQGAAGRDRRRARRRPGPPWCWPRTTSSSPPRSPPAPS